MKLRFLTNTVILRLDENDFEILGRTGDLTESVQFHHEVFCYRIQLETTHQIDMKLVPGQIIMSFPVEEFEKWKNSSKIGYERLIGETRLIIEKDIRKQRK